MAAGEQHVLKAQLEVMTAPAPLPAAAQVTFCAPGIEEL